MHDALTAERLRAVIDRLGVTDEEKAFLAVRLAHACPADAITATLLGFKVFVNPLMPPNYLALANRNNECTHIVRLDGNG